MKQNDYDFRNLWAESINQRTIEYGSDLANICEPASLKCIMENFQGKKIEKELQEGLLDEWRSEKLPQTGFYLFDNVNMFVVDKEARYKLVKIYYRFRQLHKYSIPTKNSLEKAKNLFNFGNYDLDTDGTISVVERNALHALDKLDFYQNLCQEALAEYFLALKRNDDLADCRAPKQVIFLDFCLRFPEKLTAIKHVGKLRTKTRQRLNVDSKTWIGF